MGVAVVFMYIGVLVEHIFVPRFNEQINDIVGFLMYLDSYLHSWIHIGLVFCIIWTGIELIIGGIWTCALIV